MSLLNLKIGARLYAGFTLLILFCAGLAGLGVWQLWAIQEGYARLSVQSHNTIRAVEIAKDLHAARRALLRYEFDQDEASFADGEQRLVNVAALLGEAAKTTTSAERRTEYQEMSKKIDQVKADRLALGEAETRMVTGRKSLFADGDSMVEVLQKYIDATKGTAFEQPARALEAKVLLVRVANWRMLATRDPNGQATFKTNVDKARQQIAEIEKSNLPENLAAMVAPVKLYLGKYADAFDRVSTNMMKADDIFYKDVVPVVESLVEKMRLAQKETSEHFAKVAEEVDARIVATVTMQQVVAGAAVVIGLMIAFLIARGIIRPLSGLTSGMKELAGGNFAVVLPGLERKDEIGDMAQAVETFKVKAEERARDEAETKIRQDEVLARQRKAEMAKMADDFEGAVGRIVETVSSASRELEASAGTLTSAASRSQQLSTNVAAASEEASTNVQSVASATEELSSSVNEISRQVQESARIATEAVGQARGTTERVSELSRAASRIGDVVELINTIAGQTNLLALNATIEAARAGEAGRGFAVVASEVKALAEQTAKATGEIGQQISGIQAATQESVGAIREISGTIERLSEISSTIASAVEEQGAATQEISRNVQQAAHGTQQVSSNITDVQRGASETGSASSQVLSAAQTLSGDADRLKSEVSRFLDSVRAA